MAAIDAIGVYPVEGAQDVHLVELMVRGLDGPPDIGAITQPDDARPQSEWQVPYDDKILDATGQTTVADPWRRHDPAIWQDDVRIAFFFHYLRLDPPLETPFGDVALPEPAPRPPRLDFMEYEPRRRFREFFDLSAEGRPSGRGRSAGEAENDRDSEPQRPRRRSAGAKKEEPPRESHFPRITVGTNISFRRADWSSYGLYDLTLKTISRTRYSARCSSTDAS